MNKFIESSSVIGLRSVGFASLAAGVLLSGCHSPREFPSTADSKFSRLYARENPEALELAKGTTTLGTTKNRISRRAAFLQEKLSQSSDEDDIDDLEDELEILSYLDRMVRDSTEGRVEEKQVQSVNLQVERILNQLEDPNAGSGAAHRIPQMLTGFLPTALLGNRIKVPAPGRETNPIGMKGAAKEASFLYEPEGKRFYQKEELSRMSPVEIAELDVSPDHPAWKRRDRVASDPVAAFENAMERGVNRSLVEKGDLPSGASWDLQDSRKVLFMEKVYKSATSAKGRVEDAYGIEWKIKWGDEVQSEPVSSRLFLMAGGKMTDLVFAGGGGSNGTIVVLGKEGSYDKDDEDEREPRSVEQIREALDDFYGFDITPYVHSQGVISRGNVDSLLKNLPANGKKKYRKSELIGRQWVAFREFSLELRPKGFMRDLDGASMNDLAASEDRAARGLYLMSLWLTNRDSKDDNNKTYLTRDPMLPRKNAITGNFDGQHDLGVTLGSLASAATINKLSTGKDFLRKSLSGRSLLSRQIFVYKPGAYHNATWSDSRWMAMRISNISDSQIREAVAASGWPDFMQEALVYKLTSRRNQIARLFWIDDERHVDQAAPSITIDLSSSQKVRNAEVRYGLVSGSLAEEISRKHRGEVGIETLIREGQVVASDESALITQLTIQKYPAGLSDRYHRALNRQPEALRR